MKKHKLHRTIRVCSSTGMEEVEKYIREGWIVKQKSLSLGGYLDYLMEYRGEENG